MKNVNLKRLFCQVTYGFFDRTCTPLQQPTFMFVTKKGHTVDNQGEKTTVKQDIKTRNSW